MKIENSGVNVTPRLQAADTAARKIELSQKGSAKVVIEESPQQRITDSVVLSKISAGTTKSVDYGASITKSQEANLQNTHLQNKLQPMTNLKKTADERLKQFGSESDTVESMSELNLDDDRQDMVEIAKLRVNSGFYDRPDVLDEIARRIIEGV